MTTLTSSQQEILRRINALKAQAKPVHRRELLALAHQLTREDDRAYERNREPHARQQPRLRALGE